MIRVRHAILGLCTFCLCLSAPTSPAARGGKTFHQTPPDLTAGGKPDDTRDWRLGPLGANGWVFNRPSRAGASSLARQILITRVDANGPAARHLQVDDVILGINGQPFTKDARRALGEAIDEAESEEQQGRLNLLVWRQGEQGEAVITLPVLGRYSPTMPFDCPKTDKIIDQGCDYLKDKPLKPDWLGYIAGLGLLSTGREDVLPKLRDFAHEVCIPGEVLSIEKHVSMKCWHWSYKTLFLCEYYLRTQDEYVLPTITEYATKIAMGQSGAGTWGHTYAAIENTGSLHGYLGGYGAINQQGLTLMICLALAERCGVTNDEIAAALVRGTNFFSYFIGKGTIPYGDHGAANQWFDDNGKSGSAAIFFNLIDDREGPDFFSEMILGSAPTGREAGHTGCYWSHLWGGIGAASGGELALQTFFKEMNWAFTLERQPDGRMVFQGNAGEAGDLGDPKTKWDCTGARLLQLCVPRRQLYITGKAMPTESSLTPERADYLLEVGRLYGDEKAREALSRAEIFKLLEDPLPTVRYIGARSLAAQEIHCVDQLMALLDSDNKYARYGAAEALGQAGYGSQEAADKLMRLMAEDDDLTFQIYAIAALINRDKTHGLLAAARPAIPVLLKMAVQPNPSDPRKVLQHDISRALFYNGRAQPRRGLLAEYGLDGVDRSLLIPAIQEILTNENGAARSYMSWVYPELTDDEISRLWGDIYLATRHIAPSGIMFASGIRLAGLQAMAQHRIREGLYLSAWYLRHQKGHGRGSRIPAALDALLMYGAHAKAVLPQLEENARYYETQRPRGQIRPDDPANRIWEAIEAIKAIDTPPEGDLISIRPIINRS